MQLPAVAMITNLENGRAVVVRVNDRGPASPARLTEISRRTALLLAVADERAVRVRMRVLEAESRQLAVEMQAAAPAGSPILAVAAAPRGGVQSETLAAPRGAATSVEPRQAAALPGVAARPNGPAPAPIPLRLPELVSQGVARPGTLAVDCGSFGRPEYAEIMRARIAALGAAVTTAYDAPREGAFRVRISGLAGAAQADAMLARVLGAGVTGARIVVE